MSQELRQNTTGNHVASSNERPAQGGRDLTYDQKKAAEAAFRGEPFNPAWSVAAATVYEGIVSAMCRMQVAALTNPAVEAPEECLTR
ncbi:MAG: hypothetical protein LZF60_360017 [Nitrospira sp.]|nr:hypothetical protein [Nitrospira sp.]ULA61670.1 MAG: hypothetical protein LZF60_360017 [Nitrospira sp.]